MNGSCLLILLILCAMNRCCGESSENSSSCGCGNQSVIQPRRERQENSQSDCRREQDSCGCENSRDERASSDRGCRKDPEPCFEQVRPFMPYPNANSNSGCGCGKN